MSPSQPHSLFDIVGPVMVGPSSSHTAGAVRLARLASLAAGGTLDTVTMTLYNSFAQTYKGHGTDKGLVAGLLGMQVDDVDIPEAFALAEKKGLRYTLVPELKPNAHPPNTVLFDMTLDSGERASVLGHSVGGGQVYVSKLNQYSVSLTGQQPTLILFYKDQPGMIWQVTKVIAEAGVNIASLECDRTQRGVEAFMSIALDEPLQEGQIKAIEAIGGIFIVRHLDKVA